MYSHLHRVLEQGCYILGTYFGLRRRKKLGSSPTYQTVPILRLLENKFKRCILTIFDNTWLTKTSFSKYIYRDRAFHYIAWFQCWLSHQLYSHLHHVLGQDYYILDTCCGLRRRKKLGSSPTHQTVPILRLLENRFYSHI